jgi:nucleotide-binding universal stress UspA family protein
LPLKFVHVGALTEDRDRGLRELIASEIGTDFDLIADDRVMPVEDVICTAAERLGASLLVIGALEREKPLKDLVGSTARRVAQRAGCSVLLVSTAGRDASTWSRFLISVPLDNPSTDVVDAVLSLAHGSGRAAVCFAAERSGAGFRGTYESAREFDVQGSAYAGLPTDQHALATFASGFDARGLDVSAIALSGRAGHEVSRYAEEYGADVLGLSAPNRPLGFFDRFFSHPTVVVMEKLPCSVLIVRGRGPAHARRA